MKKNYQEPSTKVEQIDIQQPLLTGSVESSMGGDATMPAKSREFGFFGDTGDFGDVSNFSEFSDIPIGF